MKMPEWRCEAISDHCWRVYANDAYCDLDIDPELLTLAEAAGKRDIVIGSELLGVIEALTQAVSEAS